MWVCHSSEALSISLIHTFCPGLWQRGGVPVHTLLAPEEPVARGQPWYFKDFFHGGWGGGLSQLSLIHTFCPGLWQRGGVPVHGVRGAANDAASGRAPGAHRRQKVRAAQGAAPAGRLRRSEPGGHAHLRHWQVAFVPCSAVDPDPDPGGQQYPSNIEKNLKCRMFSFEGWRRFFCRLDRSKLQFWIKKIFGCIFFLQFSVIQTLDPDSLEMLDSMNRDPQLWFPDTCYKLHSQLLSLTVGRICVEFNLDPDRTFLRNEVWVIKRLTWSRVL